LNGIGLIDQIVTLSDLLLLSGFMLFMWKASPPRSIQKLYPFKVRMRYLFWFSGRWRDEVAPEHVQAIKKFRAGLLIFIIVTWFVALAKFAYYELLFAQLHGIR
jgi:hypothetical protein